MARIKGANEYKRLENGVKLSRKEAIYAMCYECNGYEQSNDDCENKGCPLYAFSPYRGK